MHVLIDYSESVEDAGLSTEQVVHDYLYELEAMGFLDSYLRRVGVNRLAYDKIQSPFQLLSGQEVRLPDPKRIVTAEMLDGSGVKPESKIFVPDDPLLTLVQKWDWDDTFELVDGGLFTIYGGGFLSLFAWVNQREITSSEIRWLKRVCTEPQEAFRELSQVL